MITRRTPVNRDTLQRRADGQDDPCVTKDGRIARMAFRFCRGLAVFLIATALLKLWGVLAELPVLRTPDPVLGFLTVRQTTFAAALLELGVVYWLWGRAHARDAPWAMLWLVAIFATYRLGLHVADFTGDCNCLGPLPNYFPLSHAWLEWLSPVVLVVMAVGGLGTILVAPGRNRPSSARQHSKAPDTARGL